MKTSSQAGDHTLCLTLNIYTHFSFYCHHCPISDQHTAKNPSRKQLSNSTCQFCSEMKSQNITWKVSPSSVQIIFSFLFPQIQCPTNQAASLFIPQIYWSKLDSEWNVSFFSSFDQQFWNASLFP